MRGQVIGRLAGRRRRVPSAEPGLGSEAELRAAYNAHGGELYRFALRQLGDEGAAQEVVQEVFLRAWRRADSYDPALASLRSWLFVIARSAVIDEVRRVAVRPWRRELAEDPEQGAGMAASVPGAERALVDGWVVEEALRRIRPEHREAIVQTHLLGRPSAEVAGELGIAPATVRSRVFYGMKALRLAMDEMGVEQ